MELLMGLICVGLVLVVQKVHQLQAEVQRLEDRLNEMGDQFTDTKPASEPLGQAEQQTAAEPEAKHFTLARDLKVSCQSEMLCLRLRCGLLLRLAKRLGCRLGIGELIPHFIQSILESLNFCLKLMNLLHNQNQSHADQSH